MKPIADFAKSRLEFSNATLPAEFVVKIEDKGQGWGEWSVIAVRN